MWMLLQLKAALALAEIYRYLRVDLVITRSEQFCNWPKNFNTKLTPVTIGVASQRISLENGKTANLPPDCLPQTYKVGVSIAAQWHQCQGELWLYPSVHNDHEPVCTGLAAPILSNIMP